MSSVTPLVSPRRGDILEGELGPYIPASPVKDFAAGVIVGEAWPSVVANSVQEGSNNTTHPVQVRLSDREAEGAARATGEAHFGSTESADGWMDPFPVLGVAAAPTDESANPAPVVIQLERNQPDLSPDSTDGNRNPTSAELMETAELKEVHPLVDCQLDTAEDHLHHVTGSILAQATGSSGASAVETIPGQSTESLETQEAENPDIQAAETPKAAIIASSAQRATAHAMIYSNSGSVNPSIIIENKTRHFPVMNSDATEAPRSLERGDRGATVTTGVAGAEHKTRTGQQYTQISRTHVEPALEEVGETSRIYSHFGHTVAPSATAETEMENGSTAVADRRHEMAMHQSEVLEADLCESLPGILEIDFRESRRNDDVIRASPIESALLPDARPDQPTSTLEAQSNEVQPSKSSHDTQEVPDRVAEPESEELAEDCGASSSDDANIQEPTTSEEQEETLNSDTPITRNESEPPDIGSQRPVRVSRRPTHFQDTNFETQFQPTNRKRKCRIIKRKDQTRNNIANVEKATSW